MRKIDTSEPGHSKLAPFSDVDGTALADQLDIDRFLSLGSYRFYDALLDAPPSDERVATLVRLGIPRPFLINRGTVRETFALLEARRSARTRHRRPGAAPPRRRASETLVRAFPGGRAGIVPTTKGKEGDN
jgi:hypothetical protein